MCLGSGASHTNIKLFEMLRSVTKRWRLKTRNKTGWLVCVTTHTRLCKLHNRALAMWCVCSHECTSTEQEELEHTTLGGTPKKSHQCLFLEPCYCAEISGLSTCRGEKQAALRWKTLSARRWQKSRALIGKNITSPNASCSSVIRETAFG